MTMTQTPKTLPKTFYLYATMTSIVAAVVFAYIPMLFGTGAPQGIDWLIPIVTATMILTLGTIGAREEYALKQAGY